MIIMSQSNIRKIKPFQENQQTAANGQNIAMPEHMIAAGPPVSLADRKFELTRMKEQIEADLAQIDAELKAQLQEGDVVSTHHGVGYRLSVAKHEVYEQGVIRELSRMRLLPKFVRVSTTKLKELVNEGRLSQHKFDALRQYATSTPIVTLREVPLPVNSKVS
jgi:hypothetical protein